jgi:hypothetical protein
MKNGNCGPNAPGFGRTASVQKATLIQASEGFVKPWAEI